MNTLSDATRFGCGQRRARLTIALPIAVLLITTLGEQARATDDVPRTAAGRPDLSGNYDVATATPFERDPSFANRRALDAEELAAFKERTQARVTASSRPSDPDRKAPPVGGNVGGYNSFFFDLGQGPVRVGDEYRTSILTKPSNGRLPAFTEKGAARRKDMYTFWGKNSGEAWWLGRPVGPYDGPESLSIADRCIHHYESSIPVLPRAYNNVKTIVQTESHVMILNEWMHLARIVRLNQEHRPEEIRSRGGDSIGWWEGDTLVVETTHFQEEEWITLTVGGNASATSDQKVIERFTRVDKESLLYQFTVESSDYEAPFGGEYTWPVTDQLLYEYACHEGNYAMGNILRGARLLEQEAE